MTGVLPNNAGKPATDDGLAALVIVAGIHGVAADKEQLLHEFGHDKFDTHTILLAARRIGLHAKSIRQSVSRLDRTPLPAIGIDTAGNYFILGKYENVSGRAKVFIQYIDQSPRALLGSDLQEIWKGDLILFTSQAMYDERMQNFDFSWFVPAIVKYRFLLAEVLAISLGLQVIGLVTPFFFQVVMDKVLVNHAMQTLNVIAIGLLASIFFEASLSGIRSRVFSHTCSKIDVELGARIFRHLLSLPMPYFHARRVGDSVARVRELENIRSFLTSNAMTVLLDLPFSLIFLAAMLWYSRSLTLIVLASIPVYVALSVFLTPVIRARLDTKFNRGAENQSFLFETISSVDTIKAMAAEPRWQKKWDDQLAGYVTASLASTNVATVANVSVNLVGKLVSAAIMWLGAALVIKRELTVGELIAFNMLAGQMAAPILRFSQLWNDFHQIGISMRRLGDILNSPPEVVGRRSRLPAISGALEFDNVYFRYRHDAAHVLRGVSFRIRPGNVVGVVGRSGSGKSTLTKLIQRFYLPEQGRVLVDGHDISTIDAASLRRQIGVVLQENILFNRSVRENIAVTNPIASLEEVIEVAKLAGAHEFICELPEGYDTVVGEHGVGLSGGQRQRIAIARALLGDPRILIFDEATSALDYESERIVQENMRRICAGRTVIIVAHRLSAVRSADCIVVLDRGHIAEFGTHEELIADGQGIYSRLYSMQNFS